jgi:hypothetical protein
VGIRGFLTLGRIWGVILQFWRELAIAELEWRLRAGIPRARYEGCHIATSASDLLKTAPITTPLYTFPAMNIHSGKRTGGDSIMRLSPV